MTPEQLRDFLRAKGHPAELGESGDTVVIALRNGYAIYATSRGNQWDVSVEDTHALTVESGEQTPDVWPSVARLLAAYGNADAPEGA